MLQIFDRLLDLFRSSKGGGGKAGRVCPNGHVMHPSWDMCRSEEVV